MADETQQIAQVSFNVATDGNDELARAAAAMRDNAAAAVTMATAVDGVSVAQEKVEAFTRRTVASFQRAGSEYAKTVQDLASAQRVLNEATAKLSSNSESHPENLGLNSEAIATFTQKVVDLQAKLQSLREPTGDITAAFQSQGSAMEALITAAGGMTTALISAAEAERGLAAAASTRDLGGAQFQAAAQDIESMTAALTSLVKAYSPLRMATAAYVEDVNRIAAADKVAIISADEVQAARLSANSALAASVRNAAPQYTVPTRSQSLSLSGADEGSVIAAIREENTAMAAQQAELDKTAAAYSRLFDEADAKMAALAAQDAELATMMKEVTDSTTALDGTVDRLTARFSGVTPATERYLAALSDIADANALQILDAKQLANALDEVTAAYERAGGQLYTVASRPQDYFANTDYIAASHQRAAAQANTAYLGRGGVTPIQQIIGQNTGISSSAGSAADSAAVFGQSLDAITAKYDPLFAAQLKYDEQLKEIAADERSLGGATDLTNQARSNAALALAKATQAVQEANEAGTQQIAKNGQQEFAQRQLAVQTTQFFSQIMSGQPVMQAFIQQGHQVVDVAESTGVGFSAVTGVLRTIGGYLLGPAGLTAGFAAAAGGLAYLGVEALRSEDQVNRLGVTLRATRSDSLVSAQNAISAGDSFSQQTGVSKKDSRAAAATIAGTYDFVGGTAQITELLNVSRDLAAVMGTTVPDAAKTLSAAMEDPAREADSLAQQHFPGFTDAVARNVKELQASGQSAAAFSEVLSTLQANISRASQATSPLDDSLSALQTAYDKLTGSNQSFMADLSEGLSKDVLFALEQLTEVLNGLDAAKKAIFDGAPQTAGQAAQTANFQTGMGVSGFGVNQREVMDLPAYHGPGSLLRDLGAPGDAGGPDYSPSAISALLTKLGGPNASALQALQSTEGVWNGQSWQTSPTGALGPMQVLPSLFYGEKDRPGSGIVNQLSDFPLTAAAIAQNGGKADLNNPAISATAGAEEFQQLLQKYNGDVWDATLAYHYGEPVADAFINGGSDAKIQATDKGAGIDQANRVTSYLGLESGASRHVSGPIVSNAASSDAENAQVSSLNPLIYQQQQNSDAQKLVQQSLQNDVPGSEKQIADQQALTTLQQQATDLKTSFDKLMISLGQSNSLFGENAGAAREYAQALEEAQRQNGNLPLSSTQTDQVNSATRDRLRGQFTDQISQINQQTDELSKQAAGYTTNTLAMDENNNAAKASIDALQYAKAGTADYYTNVALLTDALNKQTEAQHAVNNETEAAGERQALANVQQSLSTVGLTPQQQQRVQASYQETTRLQTEGVDPNSQEGQQRLSVVDQTTAAQQQLEKIQQQIAEVHDFSTSAFGDIGDSIVETFARGNESAQDFVSALRSAITDVTSQLLKVAVVQPLENYAAQSITQNLSNSLGINLGGSSAGGVSSGSTGSSGGSILSSLLSSNGGGSSILSGISQYFGIGGTASATGSDAAFLSAANGGASSSASAGLLGGAGSSVLGAAGGILGGLTMAQASGNGKTGSNAQDTRIGGDVGTGIGTAIGAFGGPVGMALGGMIGSELGSMIGGLFGASQHNGWNVKLGAGSNGMLAVTNSGFEGTSKDTSQNVLDQTNMQVKQVNQLLTEYGATVSGATVFGGDNGANGANLKGQAQTFEQAMGDLVYKSTDAIIQKALDSYGASGALNSINNLAQVLSQAKGLSDSVGNLSDPLGTSGSGNFLTDNYTGMGGSIASQSASYWQNVYAPQLNEASAIGDTADYNKLIAGFNQIVAKLNDQATYQVQQTDYGYTSATESANGQTFASQNTQMQASVQQQQQSLQQELDGLYGTAYESTAAYADQMSQLNSEISAQQAQLARQQAQQVTTDMVGLSTNDLSWQASGASALGKTNLAAQLSLQSSQQTEMNQAVINLTALLENGEIDQAAYNDQIQKLTTAQAQETAGLAQQQALANKTSLDTFSANTLSFTARTITADGGNPEQAALDNFDAQAATQVDQLTSSLQTMLNNGIISTSDYYAQITQLDQTLAAERLAVQQQYVDQANSQLTSQISSLQSFLTGLESDIGTPMEQYQNTSATFQQDLAGSQSGNIEDFNNLQSAAQAFLSASKAANGVGTTAYMNDLQMVVNAIGSVTGSQSTLDALTAATMAQISETQTEKMVDAINQVKAEIVKLNTLYQQSVTAPTK